MKTWLRRNNFILVAALISLTSSSANSKIEQSPAQQARQLKRLQHAIDEIYVNPKVAETEFLCLKVPAAKAYLAFLYKTKKVVVPDASKRADSLMHKALLEVPNGGPLGDIDPKPFVHYKTVGELLKPLRFITEFDDTTSPPIKMFEEYPDAVMQAYSAHYYSSMERADNFKLSKGDDVFKIPQVKTFRATLKEMYGEARDPGTIVNGYYRQRHMAELEAALAPKTYVKDWTTAENTKNFKETAEFLKWWSTQELWNQQTYLRLQHETKAAEKPLADHYKKRFGVSDKTAQKYAKAVLRGQTCIWLDNFSHYGAAENQNNPIYKAFSSSGLTVDGIKEKIGAREITSDELKQALRLTILCDGTVESVDWAIKHGAPLTGDRENALFSAVKRPDVVALLLKAGADVNAANPLGKTALIQAAQYNALAAMKLLVEAGADINSKMCKSGDDMPEKAKFANDYFYDFGERTALMYAAAFSDKATIDYLLSKGANTKAKDSAGWTASQFLQWNKIISKADCAQLAVALQ